MSSVIEKTMDSVLDVLITNNGVWVGPWMQVLSSLAQEVTGEAESQPGTTSYQQVTLAVRRLEAIGLVAVERYYHRESQKRNVVTKVELAL